MIITITQTTRATNPAKQYNKVDTWIPVDYGNDAVTFGGVCAAFESIAGYLIKVVYALEEAWVAVGCA